VENRQPILRSPAAADAIRRKDKNMLIKVTPYNGNDGTHGQCARWSSEPTPEQASQFVSNEWSEGETYAPEGWDGTPEYGERNGGGFWFILVICFVAVVIIAALFGITPF
jgi:hypothetical protein